MSSASHRPPATRGAHRVLAIGLAVATAMGVLAATAAPGASAGAAQVVPVGNEPGVTMRVFHVPYNLEEICTLKAGQTPNVDLLKPTINWTTPADFGDAGREDNFISHTLADLDIVTAGSYEFELRSDDGSRLSIDDEVVIDHDGLHGADPKTGSVSLSTGSHRLFIEHFEAGGGQQVTLSWKKPGDASFSLVPTSVLSTPEKVTRVTAPGNKECEGAADSPGDGLQLDGVNPAYGVVNLRPPGFDPKVTGMAWDGEDLLVLTWGGTGDPVDQTSEGKLFRLTGVKTADGPEDVTATELVGELREPQGVAVVDVDDDGEPEYYVSEKDQLSKFVDTDGNGLLNEPKSALWRVPTSGNFHEFAFGLLHKGGKFHLNLSVSIDYGGATTNPQAAGSIRGNSITIDDTTGEMKVVAGGLRTPNGIGWGPEGDAFVTDNQGGWLPASKLVHVKQDRFFNHMTTPAGPFQGNPVTKPVLWLPQNEIANSPSTPVLVPEGQPFAGQMMIGDVTYGGLQRAFLEKVEGEYQGAVFRGTQGLEAGVNEVLLGDGGTMIVGGIGGGGNWEQPGKLTYGLQKLVPTGVAPFEMKSMEVVEGGFKVTYTHPIGAETLASLPDKYVVTQWGYRPTAQYGGPKINEETLEVTSATASEDGRTVTLAIAGLRPDRVVHLRSPRPFAADSGEQLYSTEGWYTLNSYPGYVAPEPPEGVYEQEDQQLLGSANVQSEHAGYSGTGYVGGFDKVGAGVRSAVTVDAAGTYDLSLRYSNGPHPFQGPKTVTLVVNGESQVVTLPSTGTWQSYSTFRQAVDLSAGANTVEIRYDEGNDGNVNLDVLGIVSQDGIRYEAEEGLLNGGASAQTEHPGYSGSGFVGGFQNAGASARLSVSTTSAGNHPVTLGYAAGPNPYDGPKRLTVEVNGAPRQITLPSTGTWQTWGTWTGELPLRVGENTVTFRYDPGDDGNVNLDYLDVRLPAPVTCDPTGEPDDPFEGDALDRCRWTNVLNEDADRYRVVDGKLEIDAQAGDLSGGQTDAKNVILQPVTGDDPSTWMAETTVSIDGTDDYLQAGLTVWGSTSDYGKVMVMRHPTNGWTTELARVTNGSLQYANAPITAGQQTDIRLRMWSDGELLQGAYSVDDGATWVTIGDGWRAGGLANPLVGVAAYNGTGAEVARFDDFTLGEPPVVPDPPETCRPVRPEIGYTSLFDGTRASLEDWEMADGGRFVRQDDCSIKSVGAFGLLWHTEPIDYAYSLRLDWMMPGDDNSGVFVGFPDPGTSSGGPITQGHEVQIDPSDDADSTTGAIYNFQAADAQARDAALKPAGQWNAYEIVVEGDRIRVYLNGTLINDFTDTDPDRMNLPSHIGLQTHGDQDDVFFRNVRINNLEEPDVVASTVTATAKPASVRAGGATDVAVTVTADGATPTGRVTVRDGAKVVGTGTLARGRASVRVGPLTTVGTRSLSVAYAGGGQVSGSRTVVRVVVTPAPKPVLTVRPPVVDAGKTRRTGSLKVTCRPVGVRCAGTLTLRSSGKVLGTARISVAGGRTAAVRVALNRRARALLADRARVQARLTVTLRGGARSTVTVRLTR
ncbi:DUF1080 domain-containing protein [Nocardioides sp. cx-169]|uniref:family 16 glycoside hydrolase n=1 Tax=Nocardioides sp. cx-169 TaxID=2899080 RepID=UPI001E45FF8C|nr:family 16 glycoside hydrolase [Nocardioides sp. cx-169]MCD4532693.1 DUF1080 domain-containing protein [Nocardioides sp. cx-169]